ncbi:cation:proton antiporter [Phycicoccus sp. CSK15P-2]|uniref:cation:proton antiporter domain-containing protein n=1 Tax=Phycicoccus sp. CSK15P-2 TaxID=2807627 RepID=UPI00194DF5B9|nr:cation:proton antiporter [Phycicoccus sp. CSK15P-2]MBM6406082.1 cation:proton antiporter [Phycicoccus sp. CSK15P-2]
MVVTAASEVPPYLAPTAALVVAAAVVGYLSVRARVVSIVGFLLAGILIGPAQLGLVSSTEAVDAAAEVGVILLLFTIGIEFSLDRLARVWRWIVLGGGAQVLLAVGVSTGLVTASGGGWRTGLFTGFLVALSSTAIVLTLLGERGQSATTRGRLALAVLVFQDLAVVAMVVLVPLLSEDASGGTGALLRALGMAVAVVAVVLVVARRLMPPVLERVAALCSPEVFLLTVVAICLGTAYLTALAGVSVSLGAFLAGLVVSESRQSTQALAEVLPLKIIFSAVFFVSVGMLLDVGFLLGNLVLVVGLALAVLVVKTVTTTAALLPTRVGWRHALATGLLLGQVGEFSFVLLTVGDESGLSPAGLGEDGFQALVATTVLLMVLTPLLATAGNRLLAKAPPDEVGPGAPEPEAEGDWADHVVILGWGADSVDLGRDLRARGVPVVMTTLNPAGVAAAERAGVPVVTGDSTRSAVLDLVGVARARLVVIAEDEPEQATRVATVVRDRSQAPVLVRSRAGADLPGLSEAGVEHVIDPGATTRDRMFAAVMRSLDLPRHALPVRDRQSRTHVDTTRLVLVPVPTGSGCTHAAASVPVLPTSWGCEECLRGGGDWVHLRLCLQCGHVGCCDSSPERHARAHHAEHDHPLMASAEPGETWAYCFVDDVTFDGPQR